jgi:hypothetical protein
MKSKRQYSKNDKISWPGKNGWVPKGSNIKKGDVMQATTEAMTSCGERLRDKSQEYLLSGKIVKYCT